MNKYRVTMKNATITNAGALAEIVAIDYVPEGILDSYVRDAQSKWCFVEVSSDPDFGPGGPDGPTVIPTQE